VIVFADQISSALGQRAEVIIVAVAICALIFELVRRRHLMERYAILWLVAGVTLLTLAVWRGLLTTLSHAVGIYYPPAALFAVGFLFVLVMLVHFSITVSRLSDQNKVLAQRVALLRQRLEEREVQEEAEEEASEPERVASASTTADERAAGGSSRSR
jgi:hypothetical protein